MNSQIQASTFWMYLVFINAFEWRKDLCFTIAFRVLKLRYSLQYFVIGLV